MNGFVWKAANLMNANTCEREKKRTHLLKAFVFQTAHQYARRIFQSEFIDDADETLTCAAQAIMKESEEQEKLAHEVLEKTDQNDLQIFVSHYAVVILLNKAAYFVNKHHKSGLIREQEAQEYLKEIDEKIKEVQMCTIDHPNG